jgi:hypothetical protein
LSPDLCVPEKARTPLSHVNSSSEETFELIYKMQQACFTFMIIIQAECAVTTNEKLQANLKKVIDKTMALELEAHTWRSAFYYRYNQSPLDYF